MKEKSTEYVPLPDQMRSGYKRSANLLRNGFVLGGLAIYTLAILVLCIEYDQPPGDMLTVGVIVGIGLTVIVWLLTHPLSTVVDRPQLMGEGWLLVGLIGWVGFYVTWGSSAINAFLPLFITQNTLLSLLVSTDKKLIIFVLIPYGVYRRAGFTLTEFGLKDAPVKIFCRQSLVLLAILSVSLSTYQYYFSEAGKSLRSGTLSPVQLPYSLPLTFAYLVLDVGLVEEFFFRALLQSRLRVLLRSSTGGIVLSLLVFGLIHAPGLYVRGAESEGITQVLPFSFFAAYTIAYMGVTGIFLSVAWQRTRNLWLLMAIHAMVDLLPTLVLLNSMEK